MVIKEMSAGHINMPSTGFISKIIGACALLLVSTGSWGFVISGGAHDGSDVGELDTYLAIIQPENSGETTETNWVNSVLSTTDTTYEIKTETLSIFNTDNASIRAFTLAGSGNPLVYPDYFLVKNAQFSALFANVADISWGVIDVIALEVLALNLDPLGQGFNLDGMTVSHVTEFSGGDGGPFNVPAPASLLILGLGLIGFSVGGRKVTSKS